MIRISERWAVLAGGESQRKGGDIELSIARLLDLKHAKSYSIADTSHRHDDAIAVADRKGRVVMFGGFVVSQLKIPGFKGKMRIINLPTAVPAVERWELPETN